MGPFSCNVSRTLLITLISKRLQHPVNEDVLTIPEAFFKPSTNIKSVAFLMPPKKIMYKKTSKHNFFCQKSHKTNNDINSLSSWPNIVMILSVSPSRVSRTVNERQMPSPWHKEPFFQTVLVTWSCKLKEKHQSVGI